MSIESVMPSNQLILCCPLLLLFSIFPSIRVFSNESVQNTSIFKKLKKNSVNICVSPFPLICVFFHQYHTVLIIVDFFLFFLSVNVLRQMWEEWRGSTKMAPGLREGVKPQREEGGRYRSLEDTGLWLFCTSACGGLDSNEFIPAARPHTWSAQPPPGGR